MSTPYGTGNNAFLWIPNDRETLMMEKITTLPSAHWPEIIDIDGLRDMPVFPTDALPSWVARYIRAQSTASQVPEDMTGMLVLAALSAAMQGRVNAITNNTSWREPVTLYVAVVMEPGERKSSIFARVTEPLREWESEVQAREAPLVAASQMERKELEDSIESLNRKLQKQNAAVRDLRANELAGPDSVHAAMADASVIREQLIDTAVRLHQHETRYKMRLLYNDLTPEACSQALSQHRFETLSIMSSEGGVFEVLTGGRYSDRLNLDVFLKGHSGDSIQTDRIGRESETIMRPMLTLGLAVQPAVLSEIGKSKQMHGRGLLGRFAYSIPETLLGDRVILSETMPEPIHADYMNGVKSLAESAYSQSSVHLLFMTDEAHEAFCDYQVVLEPRLKPGVGDLTNIPDWSGKLAGLVLRVAVLRAAARVRGVPEEVELEDVNAAIEFAPYLEAHAMRAFAMMGIIPNLGLERKIIERVKAEKLTEFKSRELQHKLYAARALSSEELEKVLDELQSLGYIKRITTGLKPLRWHWAVNPAVLEEGG